MSILIYLAYFEDSVGMGSENANNYFSSVDPTSGIGVFRDTMSPPKEIPVKDIKTRFSDVLVNIIINNNLGD